MKNKIRALILVVAGLLSVGIIIFNLTLSIPTDSKEVTTEPTKYFLSEQNGQLAIFENDLLTPVLLLDVWVESLPERDIKRIKDGIPANSLDEAISFAEDYE